MKQRKFYWLAGALAMAIPALGFANGAGNGIAGSPHDFATEAWNHRAEICRVCHVPHDHNRNQALFSVGLLWDHQVSAATYQMYAEQFPAGIDGAADTEPGGTSKLCLGCHDGTVGIDQFDNKTALAGTVFIGDWDPGYQVPGASITDIGGAKNLTGTHPISVVYNETADTNLNAKTTAMGPGTIGEYLDAGDKVQCSSCHDVHDAVAVAGTHLLRVAQTTAQGGSASGLCLTCHNK